MPIDGIIRLFDNNLAFLLEKFTTIFDQDQDNDDDNDFEVKIFLRNIEIFAINELKADISLIMKMANK